MGRCLRFGRSGHVCYKALTVIAWRTCAALADALRSRYGLRTHASPPNNFSSHSDLAQSLHGVERLSEHCSEHARCCPALPSAPPVCKCSFAHVPSPLQRTAWKPRGPCLLPKLHTGLESDPVTVSASRAPSEHSLRTPAGQSQLELTVEVLEVMLYALGLLCHRPEHLHL